MNNQTGIINTTPLSYEEFKDMTVGDSSFFRANVNEQTADEIGLSASSCSCPDSIGLGQAPYPVEWSKLSFDKKLTRKKTRAKKYKAKVLVPYLDDYREKEVGLTLWPYIKYLAITNLLQRIPVLRQSRESGRFVRTETNK